MTPLCVQVECVYLYCEVPVCQRVNVCTSMVVYMVAGCLWVLLARVNTSLRRVYQYVWCVCTGRHCE